MQYRSLTLLANEQAECDCILICIFIIAFQVLLEITTFLRETYQYIPKSKTPRRAEQATWDKNISSPRRWSSILSSSGHSERSNSRSSQGELNIGLADISHVLLWCFFSSLHL